MNDETLKLLGSILIVCFVGTWIVLGIIAFFVFFLGKNAPLKKKWFPRFGILVNVLFVLFSGSIMVVQSRSFNSLSIFAFVIPILVLFFYLNLRCTKFCDNCGSTCMNNNPFSRMRFCSKCGAEFDVQPKPTNSAID